MPSQSNYNDMLNFSKSIDVQIPQQSNKNDDLEQNQYDEMLKFSESSDITPFQEAQDLKQPKKASEVGRLGMRGLEALLGIPGDIYQSVSSPLTQYISESMKGVSGKGLTPEQFERSTSSPIFPTSEKLREKQKEIFGEKFEPTSEDERFRDEVMSDVVKVGVPILATGGHTLLTNLLRISGIVGGGQLGKKIAKSSGYGEEGQEYAKIGAQILASVINPRLGKNIYRYHYSEADRLPATVTGDATVLRNRLRDQINWANSHADTEAKRFVRAQIEPLLKDLDAQGNNPRLGYQAARELNTSINQNSQGLYELPRDVRNIARRRVDNIRNDVGNFMRQSEQTHPEFYNHWRSGNEVYGALAGSRQFGDFIRRKASTLAKAGVSHHLLSALASGMEGIPAAAIQQGAVAGTITGGYQAYKLMYKILKSPILLNAYTKAVVEGTAGNVASTANALRKIDKAIKDEEKYSFIKPKKPNK